jgi:hypothetical protein
MAKTTGKISGNLVLVSIGGVTVTCTTNASITLTRQRIPTTCKDDEGQTTYTVGGLDGSIQCDGIVKFDTASNFKLVAESIMNGATAEIQYGGLENDDDPYIVFQGFLSDLKWDGPLNNPSAFSFTAVPSGKISLFNS